MQETLTAAELNEAEKEFTVNLTSLTVPVTGGDYKSFGDVAGSAEAREAMAWAVAVGIINGSTDANGNIILNAQGIATRAQIAAIIERFCENVAR